MSRRSPIRLFMAGALAIAGCGVIAGLHDPMSAATEDVDGSGVDGGQVQEDGAAPGEDATTCVADLLNDPLHCGACGHDCAGGACTAGHCMPVVLVSEPSGESVRAVAANATHVYWANGTTNRIHRIGVDGTSREEVLDAGATQLAIDSTHLYFTSGGLRRLDLTTRTPVAVAAGLSACIGLDPDGVHVYGITAGDTIVRVQRDGGAQQTVLGPEAGVTKPWGVAVTNTHWYWSQGLHLEPDGSIYRRERPNGPTMPVHLHQRNPNCVIIGDDGLLYWPNADEGTILRSNLDGTGYETLASGQNIPTQVAMNAKSLYWNNGSQVMRLAR
jgi:hypothetical protein